MCQKLWEWKELLGERSPTTTNLEKIEEINHPRDESVKVGKVVAARITPLESINTSINNTIGGGSAIGIGKKPTPEQYEQMMATENSKQSSASASSLTNSESISDQKMPAIDTSPRLTDAKIPAQMIMQQRQQQQNMMSWAVEIETNNEAKAGGHSTLKAILKDPKRKMIANEKEALSLEDSNDDTLSNIHESTSDKSANMNDEAEEVNDGSSFFMDEDDNTCTSQLLGESEEMNIDEIEKKRLSASTSAVLVELNQKKAENEVLRKRLDERNSKVRKLEADLDVARSRNNNMITDRCLHINAAEIDNLKTSIQTIASERDEANSRVEWLLLNRQEQQQIISTMSTKTNKSDVGASLDREKKKTELVSQVTELEDPASFRASDSKFNELNSMKKDLDTKLKMCTEELKQVAGAKRKAESQLQRASVEKTELESKLSSIESKLLDEQSAKEDLSTKYSCLRTELERSQTTISKLSSEHDDMVTTHNQELEGRDKRISEVSNQYQTLLAEKRNLDAEVAQLNNHVEIVTQENGNIKECAQAKVNEVMTQSYEQQKFWSSEFGNQKRQLLDSYNKLVQELSNKRRDDFVATSEEDVQDNMLQQKLAGLSVDGDGLEDLSSSILEAFKALSLNPNVNDALAVSPPNTAATDRSFQQDVMESQRVVMERLDIMMKMIQGIDANSVRRMKSANDNEDSSSDEEDDLSRREEEELVETDAQRKRRERLAKQARDKMLQEQLAIEAKHKFEEMFGNKVVTDCNDQVVVDDKPKEEEEAEQVENEEEIIKLYRKQYYMLKAGVPEGAVLNSLQDDEDAQDIVKQLKAMIEGVTADAERDKNDH